MQTAFDKAQGQEMNPTQALVCNAEHCPDEAGDYLPLLLQQNVFKWLLHLPEIVSQDCFGEGLSPDRMGCWYMASGDVGTDGPQRPKGRAGTSSIADLGSQRSILPKLPAHTS